MPDFTLKTFTKLLLCLRDQNYTFQTFASFLKNPAQRAVILRHDVDSRKMNSLITARIENELGISGTYYFRIVPKSFDENVIKQISELGHEIGYHYEDLSLCAARQVKNGKRTQKNPLPGGARGGLKEAQGIEHRAQGRLHKIPSSEACPDRSVSGKGWVNKGTRLTVYDEEQGTGFTEEELIESAMISFRENLARLRQVVPVETICMHGSPLSKFDNRKLWEKYDYRDFGIIGEPYFDINFEEVFYLTDTGRMWDGEGVNIRDKIINRKGREHTAKHAKEEISPSPSLPISPSSSSRLHSTFDIINAAQKGELPNRMMITIHPQRWTDRIFPWMWEVVWQSVKNVGKRFLIYRLRN